jgi:hypothetical protein
VERIARFIWSLTTFQRGAWRTLLFFLIFRVVRVSGLILVASAMLTGLATGQAEVSYHFWLYGNVLALIMLIVARVEGHYFNRRHEVVGNGGVAGEVK